jgi:chaperonin GroES
MKEKTKGGVILAEDTLDRQQIASQVGLVLAMGPQCYQDKERYPEGPWCKVNNWVMFARYAGSRVKIEGGEMRMLNEDEVLATIDSPEDILHEF